ncbi:MAG TPA: stress response protein, partial [Actinomycetota bacterium]|nr:stress response protein [Actinomycetota bacterium]
GFEAVLSISNHYVTSSTEYPIEVDRRKLRKVALHHWSWVDILTEAVVQKEHRGVSDPDQAYILNELIRYMSDTRSGVLTFEGMGPGWTKVRDGAREGTLRKNDPEVGAVAARWDDLIRYVGLDLTKLLGRDVKQILPKEERTPAARQAALRESLANSGVLYAEVSVPDTSGALGISADLRTKQVALTTYLNAPKEGRSKGRVSWLLRQLQNAPDNLTIEARLGRGQSLAASLAKLRETPEALYPEAPKEIRAFVLTLTRNMGVKKDASKGSFVDSVVSTTRTSTRRSFRICGPGSQRRPRRGGPHQARARPKRRWWVSRTP